MFSCGDVLNIYCWELCSLTQQVHQLYKTAALFFSSSFVPSCFYFDVFIIFWRLKTVSN